MARFSLTTECFISNNVTDSNYLIVNFHAKRSIAIQHYLLVNISMYLWQTKIQCQYDIDSDGGFDTKVLWKHFAYL